MTLKLVGVVRVSGASQAAKDTPEIQRQAIRRIAEVHGADLLDVIEVAITVSDLTLTPEWRTRVAPKIKDPDTHVAVYHQDRLARPLDWGQDLLALNALHSTGTNIYTPDGIRDLSTEEGRMMVTMQNLISGGERARIIKRTRDGLRRHAKDGHAVVGAHALPCGIAFDKKSETWSTTPEITKVKRAFAMLLEGKPYKEIAKAVARGVTPVRQGFVNDLYRGLYRSAWMPEDMEPHRIFGGEGQPEQPISDAVWRAAQMEVRKREKRYSKPAHKAEPHTLFSGRILSAYGMAAGLPVGVSTFGFDLDLPEHVVYGHLIYGRQKEPAYLCRCIHQGWKHKCGLRTWQPFDRLHTGVEAYLAKVTTEDWFVDHLLEQMTENEDDGEAERADLLAEIAKLERKLAVAYEDRLEGVITKDAYKALADRLNAQRDALKTRLRDIKTKPKVTPGDLRAAAQQMAYPAKGTVEERRAWLDRYDVRIRLANDGVDGATVRFPLGGEDGNPVWASLGAMTWVDLLGYDLSDHWAVLEHEEGILPTSKVADRLGVPKHRVRHLHRSGKVTLSRKAGARYFWTPGDIEQAARILGVDAQPPGR